jgi:hypothetical protein
MKQRSFVKRNGKIQIKEENEHLDGHYNVVPVGSKADMIYRNDKLGFVLRGQCAFVREYIHGEYDGFNLPEGLDLSEITHTFVIIAMDTGVKKGDGMEHVLAHLQPLGETYKAIVFDMENDKPMNARIPLLPEQAEIIRLDLESEKR